MWLIFLKAGVPKSLASGEGTLAVSQHGGQHRRMEHSRCASSNENQVEQMSHLWKHIPKLITSFTNFKG